MGRIVQGAKDAIGVKSPSRVFMGIGEMISAGLAGGIDKSVAVATAAVGRLAAATVGTMQVPSFAGAPGGATGAAAGTASAGARGAALHIENFHATPEQSPGRIAEDLWFLTEARGGA
jgi:hypothetical protein